MIDERKEENASSYVLDLLSPEEREAFEGQLKEDPELRRFVRELRDSLHMPARDLDSPPHREDLRKAIHRRIDNGITIPAVRSELPVRQRFPWSFAWAAAAVFLLVVNLFLLREISDATADSVRERGGNLPRDSASVGQGGEASPQQLAARIERLRSDLQERESRLRETNTELEEARERNEELVARGVEWMREYGRLAARLRPFFQSSEGLSRFTVIEMMDAEALAQNRSHRGFGDLAGRFLTGEENIAGADRENFFGPVVEGAGVQSPGQLAEEAALTPFARQAKELLPGESPASPPEADAAPAEPAGTEPGEEATGEELPFDGEAAGFTVWRDDEQKGFLDVYNLPDPAEGREAVLWVRSSELEPYLPVGEVPELENGSGSFFYSVDEANFTPAEILITAEPTGVEAEQPSGSILLRGP
ncbi:MAG: hypothetical protein GVY10_09535 [Verrucomicrobia bacterium]|jgi:anti-sigma factor RsiW|nr:hypothetical protein [Verrucomicrobiota bacterium]